MVQKPYQKQLIHPKKGAPGFERSPFQTSWASGSVLVAVGPETAPGKICFLRNIGKQIGNEHRKHRNWLEESQNLELKILLFLV